VRLKALLLPPSSPRASKAVHPLFVGILFSDALTSILPRLNPATIGRTHFKTHFDREYLSRRPLQPDGSHGPNLEFIPNRPGCDLTVVFGSGLATLNIGVEASFGVYSSRNSPTLPTPADSQSLP
jgi:hypothetical protein